MDENGRQGDVTVLLRRIGTADSRAADELMPLVYAELRSLAGRLFRSQDVGHTLDPTAVVHEAYLKLVRPPAGDADQWSDRLHFFRVAATAMRQVLINHARDKQAAKRGGDLVRQYVTFSELATPSHDSMIDVLALHDALEELARLDARQAQIAELRFFAGLTVDEVASALNVAPRTVQLDWKMAKHWLAERLSDGLMESSA
ncbi:MAG: sigma-70 family RNA polymerase sigma factor [Phycisphaerales bacterium]|nr:sigma-70 family RNA polymerase sigma factor [Phycisphaerales bacterium]